MPVIELTVVPPSLIESAAMCECASMMPGETNRPAASTMSAPCGNRRVGAADGGDLAVAQDDGPVLNRAARDGQHRAAAIATIDGCRRLRGRLREGDRRPSPRMASIASRRSGGTSVRSRA